MGAIRLGRMHLRWCHKCGVPVLEDRKCGLCGNETHEVKLTPPGDARPAFSSDIRRLKVLIDSQFGDGSGAAVLPEGCIVLLNKAPDIDRMDEVIVGGEVVGALRYDLVKGEKFLLRPRSAIAMSKVLSKGWVTVDEGAAAAVRDKSASTLAVGVIDYDQSIEQGSEVIVIDQQGRPVSVGLAKLSADQMRIQRRGTAVKTRWTIDCGETDVPAKPASWDDALKANEAVLARRVEHAKKFIREISGEYALPVAVSYSGGKDSLATLLLVLEAGLRPDLLFIDTGLEFEETRQNVADTAREYSLNLIEERAGDAFWRNLPYFGPPGKDFRWCCKTCKLGPAVRIIQKNFPDGVLSFIGQRAYESEQRARKGDVWRNPWTPNQLSASPIQNWTAMHVWMFLFSRKAQANPLYEKGLERIGCYMCPATDLAELHRVKDISDEYTRWQQFLDSYAKQNDLPAEWTEYGLWRWRKIPKSVSEELKGMALQLRTGTHTGSEEPLVFRGTSGYNPCIEGLSMEGVFSRPLHMDRVSNLLNAIGEVVTSPDGSIAEVERMTVFREGPVMVKAKTEDELETKAGKLKEAVFRAMECAGCGICIGRCAIGAMRLDEKVWIDESRCTHCGKCLGKCPVTGFREKELDI